MKHKALESNTQLNVSIPPPIDGINLQNRVACELEALLLKNVIANAGTVCQRKGIRADLGQIITAQHLNEEAEYTYELLDNSIYYNGEYQRVAVINLFIEESFRFLYVFLISSNSKITNLGYIFFPRFDETTFEIPVKYTFFTGKPTNGLGVYAFVTFRLSNKEELDYRIYELAKDFGQWIYGHDFYIPTLMINCRGNRYEEAKDANMAYTASPIELEPVNILTGGFYTYFTSDGFSNSFRIPFTNIENSSVSCRIYYDNSNYVEWTVYADQSSTSRNFMDREVTFNVDRSMGRFYFTCSGQDYSIPVMSRYRENNIRVLAYKKIENCLSSVVSCELSTRIGSVNVFSGGISNKIFYSDYENPLYFPEITNNSVGSDEVKITAICNNGKKVILFNQDEIYTAELKSGKYIRNTAVLTDNNVKFKEPLSFNITCVSNKIGCSNNKTVSVLNDGIVWLDNNRVYRLNSACSDIKEISKNIYPLFSNNELSDFSASTDGEKYFLYNNNKVYIMNYEKDKPKWFYFEMPEGIEIHGAVIYDGEIALVCESAGLFYTAPYTGEFDAVYEGSFTNHQIKQYDILSEIKLKSANLDSGLKKNTISKILVRLNFEKDALIRINRGCNFREYTLSKHCFNKDLDGVLLPINLFGRGIAYISLTCKGRIKLDTTDIYIKK